MRFLALAFLAGLVSVGGLLAPTLALAAGAPPKVVIVVGPVAGTTPSYRSDADLAATEALKYTPNVVKIYSPNATWAAVKSALQGASIVIYMGHGNGFPSPYTTKLTPDRQDGFGLNPVAGKDDSTTQYWGEQYVASDIQLAPNAVVLLGHLCYASGSSEPGKADPTLAVARQRVDNFAAGFLAAGARAVIADAHGGAAAAYVQALFTSHQALGALWAGAFDNHGNAAAFASVRTPGMTAQLDPDGAGGPYYRSFVGDLTLQSDAVVGGAANAPATDPSSGGVSASGGTGSAGGTGGSGATGGTGGASGTGAPGTSDGFTVPGQAVVSAGNAGLFADAALTLDPTTGQPPATLPPGTAVRILAQIGNGPDGSPVFSVLTADGSRSGYMSAAALTPVQGSGPVATAFSAPTLFSPNGDGRLDTFAIRASFNEPALWQFTVVATNGSAVTTLSGSGSSLDLAWDGMANGTRVPDGTYSYRLTASDAWGNPPYQRSGTLRIDTVAPTILPRTPATLAASVISPNGDGQSDTWSGGFTSNEAGTVDAVVMQPDGSVVRNLTAASTGAPVTLTWNARSDKGSGVADGPYTIVIMAHDKAGNASGSAIVPVTVYRALGLTTASPAIFDPEDGDALAPSTVIAFNLNAQATVSADVVDSHGAVVAAVLAPTIAMAGSIALPWAGTGTTGQILPAGSYTARVTATNGSLTNTVSIPLTLGAFSIATGTPTATRGNSLTITVISAEPLAAGPRLTLTQPGQKARTVTMVAAGVTGGVQSYRVTTKILSGGKAGKLGLTVTATDTGGGVNTGTASLTLR